MSRSLLSPGVLEWRLNRKDYENLLFLPTSNPLILFHLFTHNIKHNIFERWKRYDNWKYISYSLYSYHSHRQWAAQRANRMEPEGNHMTSTPFHCEPEASGGDRRETRPGGDEGPLLHRLICLPPHGPGCYHLIWRKPVRDEPRVRRAVRPRYEKGTVGKGLVAHCRFASQPFLTIRGTVAPWLMTVPSSPSRRARSLRRVYNPFVLSSVFICWSNLGLEDRNLLLIHMFLYYISYVGPKDPVSPVGPTRLLMLEWLGSEGRESNRRNGVCKDI